MLFKQTMVWSLQKTSFLIFFFFWSFKCNIIAVIMIILSMNNKYFLNWICYEKFSGNLFLFWWIVVTLREENWSNILGLAEISKFRPIRCLRMYQWEGFQNDKTKQWSIHWDFCENNIGDWGKYLIHFLVQEFFLWKYMIYFLSWTILISLDCSINEKSINLVHVPIVLLYPDFISKYQ